MLEIKNKKDCCGCSACQQICPKACICMKRDNEGFLYPIIDKEKCISCNLCENVCPMIHKHKSAEIKDVFAYKHEDETIRKSSSSGGAFYYYAQLILNKQGVVYGAAFYDKWNVYHKRVDNIYDLDSIRRSKYVQSNINGTFKQVKKDLQESKYVLFSGTPCQVAGLNRYLGKEYERLITIDVFCHGVPSPEVYEYYLREIAHSPNTTIKSNILNCFMLCRRTKRNEIVEINFRDKEISRWRLFSLKLCFKENKNRHKIIVNNWKNDVFFQGFLSHLYLRPSCHDCRFRNQTSGSDITIGDFWGIESAIENFNDDDMGYNAIIINSEKGHKISIDMNKIATTSYKAVVRNNVSLVSSHTPHIMREIFFKHYRTFGMLFMTKVCIQMSFAAKVLRKLFYIKQL